MTAVDEIKEIIDRETQGWNNQDLDLFDEHISSRYGMAMA